MLIYQRVWYIMINAPQKHEHYYEQQDIGSLNRSEVEDSSTAEQPGLFFILPWTNHHVLAG